MKKTKYFALIKEITKAIRDKDFNYARVYSEPRILTGYSTKVFHASNPKKIAKLINKQFGNKVTAVAYVSTNAGYYNLNAENVRITPKKRVKNEA